MSLRGSTPLNLFLLTVLSIFILSTSLSAHAKPAWKGDNTTEEGTKGSGKKGRTKNTDSTISISSHPASLTIEEGHTAIFSVEASSSDGQTLSYQWLFNGTPIDNATSNSYTITSSQPSDEGEYQVTIRSTDRSTQTSAYLTVETPVSTEPDIEISLQPTSQSAYLNENLTLNVSATGSGTLHYQWRKDGLEIPNAIHSYLSISNASETESGSYDVIISNETGSVTSLSAQVTIEQLPTLSLSWTHPTYREDGSVLPAEEISSYNIYLTYENEIEEVINVPSHYASLDFEDMYPGAYQFAMATIDSSGQTGKKSSYATLVIN